MGPDEVKPAVHLVERVGYSSLPGPTPERFTDCTCGLTLIDAPSDSAMAEEWGRHVIAERVRAGRNSARLNIRGDGGWSDRSAIDTYQRVREAEAAKAADPTFVDIPLKDEWR